MVMQAAQNAIRIFGLRPKKNNDGKATEVLFPEATGKCIQSIFDNLDNILGAIVPSEQYNLYFTAARVHDREETRHGKNGNYEKTNQRALVDQEIIPFDLDHICLEQKEEYLPIVEKVLNIKLTDSIVIFTGNGIQVLVKTRNEIKNDEFFEKHRAHYKRICDEIKQRCEEAALSVDVDTSVFSPARLLRLPNTTNRKPVVAPFSEGVNIKQATLHPEYRKLGGEGLFLNENTAIDVVRDTKKKDNQEEYMLPDVDTIRKECIFVKQCLEGELDVHEPDCYAFLGITAFLKDDDVTSWEGLKKFSSPTINSMDKEAKLEQARNTVTGPRTCESIKGIHPECCAQCKHAGNVKTPLSIKGDLYFLKAVTQLPPKPTESQVVYSLLKMFGISFDPDTSKVTSSKFTRVLKEAEDLFTYQDGFWTIASGSMIDSIHRTIARLYRYNANNSKVSSTFQLFMKYVPEIPFGQSFYSPNPFVANFANGTLHAVQLSNGSFDLKFRDHDKDEYLPYILPLNYEVSGKMNSHFMEMLDNIFANETPEEKAEKIEALQMMFGAALMPIYPHLFMLKGVAGAGKSTICKLLSYLLKKDNMCSVEPKEFEGFQMESMASKLVNLVTDIDVHATIKDSVIKRIEDRIPVRIQRKGRTDLHAPLPAIHVFGCNALPRMSDGVSGAHTRRWSIITFEKSFTEGKDKEGTYNRYFAEMVFNHNAQGIMNWAIEGLRKLIAAQGHYKNPGVREMRSWQTESDFVQQFINGVEEGIVSTLMLKNDGMVSKKALYDAFVDWTMDEGIHQKYRLTRIKFIKTIVNDKKFPATRTGTDHYIKGFAPKTQESGKGVSC